MNYDDHMHELRDIDDDDDDDDDAYDFNLIYVRSGPVCR
jgi:hypothetical protein